MIKVLLIAPYKGLAETAKSMDLPEHIQLDITIGNLKDGVRIAKVAEKQGYDIIISRGGTATLIQESISIPVIHISITGYDMLRVFTLIRGIKEGVALVGFKNITDGAAIICDILDYDVKTITITTQTEVRNKLELLKQSGFSVVIGDVITVKIAKQIGLRGVLIASGKDAVMDAVTEGDRVYHFFCKVTNQYRYFQQAFQYLPRPIVLLDKYGGVLEGNNKFDNVSEHYEVVKSPSLLPLINKVLESEEHQWEEIIVGNNSYQIQGFLINKIDHIVAIMIYESFNIIEPQIIRIIGSPNHTPIIGESKRISRLKQDIQYALQTTNEIGIFGESGTGKLTLAREIHFEAFGQNAPIIIIECKELKMNTDILKHIHQGFTAINRGTIIVKNVELLSYHSQNMIGQMMKDVSNKVKVIILETTVEQNNAFIGLTELVDTTIYMEPLRLRKDDIPFLANYFLTEIRMEHGSEKVGIKSDAMEYLKQSDWNDNIPQLKKVIKDLSKMTSENYIELIHVQQLLDKQSYSDANQPKFNSVQLTGTLEEIEHAIIKQVMDEEGNNQSNTAKRLGINRSTLWRKLNKGQKKDDK